MGSLFSFNGRINRMTYFANYALYSMVVLVFFMGVLMVGSDGLRVVGLLLVFAMYAVGAVYGLSLSVRRLHDLGYSGWLILIGFIPFVGIFVALWLLFGAGQREGNQYGPPATEFRWLFKGTNE